MSSTAWRAVAAFLWLALVLAALVLAPPSDAESTALVAALVSGKFGSVDPAVVALFNLMGVLPMSLVALLALDGPYLRWTKWVFLGGSLVVGAFILLPYLALRRWDVPRERDSFLARVVESRLFAAVLLALASALVALFVARGDLAGFGALLRRSNFVAVMSFDFVACTVAGALLVAEDARLREDRSPSWLLGLLPAVGVPAYLFLRPRRGAGGAGLAAW